MDALNEEKQKLLEAIKVLVLKRKYLAALAILQATDFQLLSDVISQDMWMDNEESCIAGRKWLGWLSEMQELPEEIKTSVLIAFSKLSMVICGSFKVLRQGCNNFCVNGHLAGNCRPSRERRNDRKQRTDRQPAG